MPASFESSAAIDAIRSVRLSNGADCGSEKSTMATDALGWPNHPVTNFIAGSSALEYVAAPASWPGKLNNFKEALDKLTYSAVTNVGVTVPSGLQPHFTPIPRSLPASAEEPLASGPHSSVGVASALPPCKLNSSLNSLPPSRALHRSTTSNKLFPSEKSADSVVIGYHVTYPAPRTAVNDGLIWSQLECLAISSGTPTRISRVASSGITPS